MPIKLKIIGLAVLVGLILAPLPAYALYSSKISNQVAAIRQHVFEARQLNGTGSARHGIQKLFSDEDIERLNAVEGARRDSSGSNASNGGTAQNLPGEFYQYRQVTKGDIAKDAFSNFGEGFLLLFNRLNGKSISSCLRNDIFELEDIRDALQREALISLVKLNRTNASILWNDYKDIRAIIEILKSDYELRPNLFFGDGELNYYGNACPEGGFWGEFKLAFDDVKRSWDTLATVFKLKTLGPGAYNAQWGSIQAMAEARSRVRASEWIRANQITLNLRGEEGGDPTSIRQLYRTEGIGNIFKTEWEIFKAIIGPITPIFDGTLIYAIQGCVAYNHAEEKWQACSEEQINRYNQKKCNECRNKYEERTPFTIAEDTLIRLRERSQELVAAETTLQFNLEFSSIADETTLDLEEALNNINAEIRRASEQFGSAAGLGLQSLCKDVRTILERQCINNGGDFPACN